MAVARVCGIALLAAASSGAAASYQPREMTFASSLEYPGSWSVDDNREQVTFRSPNGDTIAEPAVQRESIGAGAQPRRRETGVFDYDDCAQRPRHRVRRLDDGEPPCAAGARKAYDYGRSRGVTWKVELTPNFL